MSSVAHPTRQVFTVILSVGVLLSALAGLVMAILNLRLRNASCSIRSLSIAYIVFFVIALLSMFGAGGAIFNLADNGLSKGTEGSLAGASASLVTLALSSLALFIISLLLVWKAKDINDSDYRKANYWVFGIFSALSLINAIFIYSQRQSLLHSQPGNEVLNYVRNRIGTMPGGMGTPATGMGAYSRPIRA